MTRRILAGLLGVLVFVLIALVVPLGLIVSAQQDKDFRADARSAANAVGAVAEEHLDDRAPSTALDTVVSRFAASGDRVAVLDRGGHLIASGGAVIPGRVLTAARNHAHLGDLHDAIVVAADIRDAGPAFGTVVLVRGREPLDRRHELLWVTLLSAAVATLAVGTFLGTSLSRWIARPLTSLAGAANRIGEGDIAAHADDSSGPPQIRELATAFNAMAGRIAALLETQRGMNADVSHQLRTPLAALRLRLELLAGEVDAAHADEVAAMLEEINRLDRLVDGLLAVARAESTTAAPEPIDLADLVTARAEAWRPVAVERGVELLVDAQPALGLATAGHAEQILDNLLDNAIDAVPTGGSITVSSQTRSRYAVLSVADNGPGMTADRRAHAFDRFVTDRSGTGGTGLGLAIVERLATNDHGDVRLTKTPGGGLTATVTLPAASHPSAPGDAR